MKTLGTRELKKREEKLSKDGKKKKKEIKLHFE